jgi:Protein of unknown function (DUF2934)
MPDNDQLIAQSHIDLDQRIHRRAHEIWLTRGGHPGQNTALDDWLQAEREILGEGWQSAQDRGTTVGRAQPY